MFPFFRPRPEGDDPEQDLRAKIAAGKFDPPPGISAKAKAEQSGTNPFNLRPFSKRYFEILNKRTLLPVWEYREQFINTLMSTQCMVLVGETGSGKTTQVSCAVLSSNCGPYGNSYLKGKFAQK